MVALERMRYNKGHDNVLSRIHSFLVNHLPQEKNIMADLPGVAYIFPWPTNGTQTEEKPGIVLWNNETVHLVDLTVPFETSLVEAANRKQKKYSPLVACCRENGFRTNLVTMDVESRGFLHRHSLNGLYNLYSEGLSQGQAGTGRRDDPQSHLRFFLHLVPLCMHNWQHPD